MTGHSSLPCFQRSDIFMLICSVSCKDETNHLLIIQAKWRPPEAERGHGLIPLGMRREKALGDFPHLQYRGPASQSLSIMSALERWISLGHPILTPEPLFTASRYYSWKQIFPRGRKQVLLRVYVSLWSLGFVK